MDSLGEFLPRELRVEDLPRLCSCVRVGDARPEFRELGRNRAVAGELDLENRIAEPVGGVVAPC